MHCAGASAACSLIRILRPGIDMPKVVPKRVEFRPRFFKRGEFARLCSNYVREHAGETVAVADMPPGAIGDRTVSTAERYRIAVGVYEALKRMERKRLVTRAGEGWKAARWRLVLRPAVEDRTEGARSI